MALTCLGAREDAMILGGHHLHSLLAVYGSIGQHHGRIVLVHELARDRADELAVHVLRPGQLLRQPLKLLQQRHPHTHTAVHGLSIARWIQNKDEDKELGRNASTSVRTKPVSALCRATTDGSRQAPRGP